MRPANYKNQYIKLQCNQDHTRELYETISEIAKESNYVDALEIGTAWGISTIAILHNGKGDLTSVDKSEYQNTENQVIDYGYMGQWRFMQKPSEEALPELLKAGYKYDLICIDGDHRYEYVKNDLKYAVKMLKKDGVIIVDDYNHKKNKQIGGDKYGVKKAVDEIVKRLGLSIEVYDKAHGIVKLWR